MQDHRKKYLLEEIVGESDNDIQQFFISQQLRQLLQQALKVGFNKASLTTLQNLQKALNKQISNLTILNRSHNDNSKSKINDSQLLLQSLRAQTLELQKSKDQKSIEQLQKIEDKHRDIVLKMQQQSIIRDLEKTYNWLKKIQQQDNIDNSLIIDQLNNFRKMLSHIFESSESHNYNQLFQAQKTHKKKNNTQKIVAKLKTYRKCLCQNFKHNFNKFLSNIQTDLQRQITSILRQYSKQYSLIEKQLQQTRYWHRQQIKQVNVVFEEIKSMQQHIKLLAQELKTTGNLIWQKNDKFTFLKKVSENIKILVQNINNSMKNNLSADLQTQQKQFFRIQIQTFNQQMLQKDKQLKQLQAKLDKQKVIIRSRQESQSKAIRQNIVTKEKLSKYQINNTQQVKLKSTETQLINKLLNNFDDVTIWEQQLSQYNQTIPLLPIYQFLLRQIQFRKKLTNDLQNIQKKQKQYIKQLGQILQFSALQSSSGEEKFSDETIHRVSVLQLENRILKQNIQKLNSKLSESQQQILLQRKIANKRSQDLDNCFEHIKYAQKRIQSCTEISQIDGILNNMNNINIRGADQALNLMKYVKKIGQTIATRFKSNDITKTSNYEQKCSSLIEKHLKEKNKLQQAYEKLKEQIQSLAQQHKQSLQQILTIQKSQKELQQVIQNKEQQLKNKQQAKQKLEQQISNLAAQVSNYEKQEVQFKNIIEKLIKNINQNKQFYEKQSKKQLNTIRQLRLAVFTAETAKKALESEVKLLSSQQQSLNSWLQTQRQSFNTKLQRYQHENNKLKSQIKQLHFNNTKKQKQYENLVQSLKRQKEQEKKSIQTIIQQKQQLLKAQQTTIKQLRSQIFFEKSKFQNQINDHQEKIHLIKQQHNQLLKINKILEKQVSIIAKEKIKLSENYETIQNKKQRQLEDLQQQTKRLNKKIRQMDKKRQISIQNMQQIVQNQCKTIKELRNTIFTKQQELRKANDKYITNIIDMKNTIDAQVQQAQQKYRNLQDKKEKVIKDDRENFGKQSAKMKKIIEDLQLENSSLKQRLDQLSYIIEKNNIKITIPKIMYSTNCTNFEKIIQQKTNYHISDILKSYVPQSCNKIYLTDRRRAFSYNSLKHPLQQNYQHPQYF